MKQITLYLLSLFVSVLLLVGCSNEPPTPEELYKEEASGVVMVLNKFLGCPVRCSEKQMLKSPVKLLI